MNNKTCFALVVVLIRAAWAASIDVFPAPISDWMTSSSTAASSIKNVPSNGSRLDSNPPSFWWNGFHTGPQTQYQFDIWIGNCSWQWSATNLTKNYLLLPFELPTNQSYGWRITKTRVGYPPVISANRTFEMLATSQSIGILPSNLTLYVSQQPHPRLVPNNLTRAKYLASYSGSGFPKRVANLAWWYAAHINDTLMQDLNVTSADFAPGSPEWAAFLSKLANDVSKQTFGIYNYAWSVWMDPTNSVNMNELRRRIRAITAFNVTGATSAVSQDQTNRDIMMSLAMAFDIMKDNLTTTERAAVVETVRLRGNQVYNNGAETKSLLKDPYDSHGANTLGFLACTALAMVGEFPEASLWLEETLPMYMALYSTWGAEDGGFGNGLGYAFFDATDSGQRWTWMSSGANVNIVAKQWIRNWPLQFIYFSPPYAETIGVGFGDSGEMDSTTGYQGLVCASVISRIFGDSTTILTAKQRNLYQWYCDRILYPNNDDRWNGHIWVAPFVVNASLTDIAMNATGYPSSIHLQQIGWVALHSSLFSKNRTSLYFRASSIGSYNHNNADQLCFTLSHRGRSILISSGYYDYYGSGQHYNWRKQTKAQSGSVTLSNDQGQKINSITATGLISQFQTSDNYDVVTATALDAYNDGFSTSSKPLTRATRSIVYLRKTNQYIIFDQFNATKPQNWTWNFHSYRPVIERGAGRGVLIESGNATVCLRVVSPANGQGLLFSQTTAFPANAQTSLANQTHARWTVSAPSVSFALVVVVDPDCTDVELVGEADIPMTRAIRVPNTSTVIAFDGNMLQEV
ncbi:hypothetical protein BDR26DRAFT_863987 [Obelidium mucronatum]|nr:hypothetical protein BDR26DRAFT_863987 [Obelidium mucronatum]